MISTIRVVRLLRFNSGSIGNLDSAEGLSQFECVNSNSDTEVWMLPPGQKRRDNR
jgi:hypothetical protein